MRIEKTAGGTAHVSALIGAADNPAQILVDVSALTANEVDSRGYLKPNVPLTRTGLLVGAAPAFVFGVTVEAVKVAASNSGADLAAAVDVFVAVHTNGLFNRDIIEDTLGRALTADEIAGFDRAGSKCALTAT